jgi:hypothetical protein
MAFRLVGVKLRSLRGLIRSGVYDESQRVVPDIPFTCDRLEL